MKKITTLILFTFLLFQNFNSTAQVDTVFWFATPFVSPDNTFRHDYKLHIYTYGATSTTIRVRQPAAIAPNSYDTTFVLGPYTSFDYIFWRDKLASTTNRGFDSLEVQPSNVVLPYGLKISSSSNISAVFDIQGVPAFNNPETFSLKGQNALGLEFLCPFQTKANNMILSDFPGTQPGIIQPKQQINIVASKPNTTVWITPKCNVIGHLANVTYSIMLPLMGSAYTIENSVQTTSIAANNLSGTSVVSDKPIAVTIADDSAKSVSGCYDLGGDQIVPVNVTGTSYVVVKGLFNSSENEGFYIVGTVNSTQVTINDAITTTTLINKGDTYFYKTNQDLTSISSTNGIYVMQLTGFGCEMGEDLVPPLSCAGASLIPFTRVGTQQFFLNLYCKNGSQGSFTLNNSSATVTIPITASQFTIVPGTSTLVGGPYYGARLSLNSPTLLPIGSYTVSNSSDDFGMSVCDGGPTSGSFFHYMSLFMKRTTVSTTTLSSYCVGSSTSISLNGNVTGASTTGTWTSNGSGIFGAYTSTLNTVSTTYSLSNADTLLSSIKFYLKSTGACNPVKDSITMQVIQRPQISTGSNTTICNTTNPIALTGTINNATGANWGGGTGFFAPGPNITYTLTPSDYSAGTLTLTLTSSGGCSTATKSITVNIIPSPTINLVSSNAVLCTGQTATLTASGANTFTWNTSSINSSITVSPTINTNYTVTGTALNGCVNTATIAQNTAVSPTISASSSNSLICTGQTATLTAGGANTYSWNTTSTNTTIVVSPTITTTYTVSGIASNGCAGATSITQNVSLCTGIKTINSESYLTIYPNPNSGEFFINAYDDVKLQIVSELGQLIKVITLNDQNDHKVLVTGLVNGIYFINGDINSKQLHQKIIVAK